MSSQLLPKEAGLQPAAFADSLLAHICRFSRPPLFHPKQTHGAWGVIRKEPSGGGKCWLRSNAYGFKARRATITPICYVWQFFSDLPTALPWMRLTHTLRGSQGFDASRVRCFRPTDAVAHDGAILCCFHASRSVLREPIGSHCFLCKKVTAEAYAGSVLLNGLSRPTYTSVL